MEWKRRFRAENGREGERLELGMEGGGGREVRAGKGRKDARKSWKRAGNQGGGGEEEQEISPYLHLQTNPLGLVGERRQS